MPELAKQPRPDPPQRGALEAPAELRRTRVVVLASDELQGAAMKALLESLGVDATYAEAPTRAARLLAGRSGILLWLADNLDGDALQMAIEIRDRGRDVGLCLVADSAHAETLRELLVHDPDRFAFVSRRTSPTPRDLVDALARVARGYGLLDGSLLRTLLDNSGPQSNGLKSLSAAEMEILELLAQGLRNREIARRLWKSERTVEKHVGSVFVKLGLADASCAHLDRRTAAARIYLSATSAFG